MAWVLYGLQVLAVMGVLLALIVGTVVIAVLGEEWLAVCRHLSTALRSWWEGE